MGHWSNFRPPHGLFSAGMSTHPKQPANQVAAPNQEIVATLQAEELIPAWGQSS